MNLNNFNHNETNIMTFEEIKTIFRTKLNNINNMSLLPANSQGLHFQERDTTFLIKLKFKKPIYNEVISHVFKNNNEVRFQKRNELESFIGIKKSMPLEVLEAYFHQLKNELPIELPLSAEGRRQRADSELISAFGAVTMFGSSQNTDTGAAASVTNANSAASASNTR
jgi:hypothetical protein